MTTADNGAAVSAGQARVSPGGLRGSPPGRWPTRGRLGAAFYPPSGRYVLDGERRCADRNIPIEEYNPAATTWTKPTC